MLLACLFHHDIQTIRYNFCKNSKKNVFQQGFSEKTNNFDKDLKDPKDLKGQKQRGMSL